MRKAVIVSLITIVIVGFMKAIVTASSSITVVDDLGRTVIIASSERIVSVGPSCTEILYALGLGDRIIAVDKYSDYPPEAVAKQKISKVLMPDPEEITALNPDLVVYYHWGPWDPTVETLSSLGLTVMALAPKTLEDIIKDTKLIGMATGKSQEAEVLASTMSQRMNEIKSKISNVAVRPRVYIESWYPPPWTFGPNTWGHQLIESAGGINVFGDAQAEWVQTTDEEVISRNPKIIISLYGAMHYATLEDFRKRPGWDKISAIANGAVYLLDENLFLRPGPRIVDGLETLAKVLHPEIFGEAKVFTFLANATLLRTGVQSFRIPDLANIDIFVIKAAGSCTLTATLSKTGPDVPSSKILVGNYIDVGCSVPEGLAFVLRIYYMGDHLEKLDVSEGSLKIYRWEREERRWVALNSAINRDEKYVETVVTNLSYFALMGEIIPPTPFWEQPIPLWLFAASLTVVVAIFVGTYVALTYRRTKGVY